ncbi:MAG: T9SS type A sorting domain-containing protein [Nonlabens sp.]
MKTKITQKRFNFNSIIAVVAVLLAFFSTMQVNAQVVLGYEFTNNVQGWNGPQTRCTVDWNSAGYLDVTTQGTNDPFFSRTVPINLDTSNVNFVELSVLNGTASSEGNILLIVDNAPNVVVPINMTPNSTTFEEVIVDLSNLANYSNNIVTRNVRIDPNTDGAVGVISYDYVRFVESPTNLITPTSITVNGPSTISTNETAQFTTSFTPSDATFQNVVYSTSDMNIATIDGSGLLTPVAAGTVTVTATTTDGSNISDTASLTITQGPSTILGWEFDTDDDGWNRVPLRCTTAWNSAGYLDVTTEGTNDPNVRNATAQPFNAAGANFFEVSVRNGTASSTGQVILFVQGGGVRTILFPMTPNSTTFETVVIDLATSVNNWSSSDVFNDVRLDPNDDGSVGVVSFDYFRFVSTLSTPSQQNLDDITMYPNPVAQGQDAFVSLERFTNADAFELSVHDITGKLIYSNEVSGGQAESISTGNMGAGLYIVSVKNENSSKTFKMIVK